MILRESLANLLSRPLLGAGLIVFIAIQLVAVALVEANENARFDLEAEDLVRSGYSTAIVRPNPDLPIDLQRGECDELAEMPGVLAATWLADAPQLRFWSAEGPSIPSSMAGPGIISVLNAHTSGFSESWRGAAIVVDTSGLATAFAGTETRSVRLSPPGGTTWPAMVLFTQLDSLGSGFRGNSIVVTPDTRGVASSCVVAIDFADRRGVRESLGVAFPAENGFGITWAMLAADDLPDPVEQFDRRPTARLWILIVIMSTVVTWLYLKLRRLDYAFYRVAGLTPRRLTGIVASELMSALVVTIISTTTLLTLTIAVSRPPGIAVSTGALAAARTVVALICSFSALAWYESSRLAHEPLDTLKDR